MHRALQLLVVMIFMQAVTAWAQTVVPADMERLRVAYESARERATRPVDEKYLAELVKLQNSYTRAAKLQEAVVVANEIKAMKERLGLPIAPHAPKLAPAAASDKAAKTDSQDVTVTIPANNPNGYRIGGVTKGDTLTLQFVDGKWKSQGGIATENPDNPKATYGENDRLVIAEPADASGAPGKVIKIVPPDTASTPFVYVIQTSRTDVVLRINNNSDRKENPGTVTYKMKLVR